MTETMRASAVSYADPATEIVAVEPEWGPVAIESHYEGYLSAAAVLDRVQTFQEPYDAVVMAGFGEPGREGVQEITERPVFDITESAAQLACLLGRSYSVVTTVDRAVEQIRDRLLLAGLERRCASIRATRLGVLSLERDPAAAARAVVEQARTALRDDRAEVIVLGCGGMAGLDGLVRDALGVPVVDGIAAAVKLAEAVHGLDLGPSKIRSYAPPPANKVARWPVSAHLGAAAATG